MTDRCAGCRLRPTAGQCLSLGCPVHPDKLYENQERVAIIAEECRIGQGEAEAKWKEMRK